MSGESLEVALVQWRAALDPAENRGALTRLAARPQVRASELVVLPEAFARDFGGADEPLASYAEPQGGPFDLALSALAEGAGTTVVAGMFEAFNPLPFNTLLVRGGARAAYRKIHLYDSFGHRESDRMSAGDWQPVVVEVSGWQVGLMTCYDLRFPELARDLAAAGAEVIVVPAAWVAGRSEEEHQVKRDHWRTLARARAIENVAWVVAAGQPGPRYTGGSLVIDPLGQVVAEAGDEATILTARLSRAVLDQARRTNPSLANRRH